MNSLIRRGTIFLILLAGIAGLHTTEAVNAQLSISVFPTIFRGNLDPGKTWEGAVTVVNPNDFPIIAVLEKENLAGGAEGEVRLLGEEATEYGLAAWTSFVNEPEEIPLAPQERKTVNFKISIPENAEPGGHYGSVLFRAKPVESASANDSGVAIAGRVGSVLLFEISGDVKKSGEISEINAPKFLSHGPIDLSFKIQNDGNTFFLPEGRAEFRNLQRTQEGVWEPRVVFPGYNRTFKTAWSDKYFIGPVKVKISANMQNGPALQEKTFIIWVFPWQEALTIIGLVLFVLLGWKTFKKKFKIVRINK
ncbi:DUF916 domain-containing protein [Patescibacteria group bacterium]|nr:DUF916 domain-containing protein [Patescibacteria group bacterium]